HFVNTLPKAIAVIIGSYIFYASHLEHLRTIVHHVLAHFMLIFLNFHVHCQYRQSPFVLHFLIKKDTVFVIWQGFSKGSEADRPFSRFAHGVFPFTADAHLRHLAAPTPPACSPLIARSTDVVTFIIPYITESRDVKPVGSPAVVVFVFVSFDPAPRPATEMMVHSIVP